MVQVNDEFIQGVLRLRGDFYRKKQEHVNDKLLFTFLMYEVALGADVFGRFLDYLMSPEAEELKLSFLSDVEESVLDLHGSIEDIVSVIAASQLNAEEEEEEED